MVNKLPTDFVWGYATAAQQVEGAVRTDGRGESIWDRFSSEQSAKVADGSTSDISCNSYDRYREDVALLKQYKCKAYRFSISWPRVIPNGGRNDVVNPEGIEYYNNLIDALLEAGITPFVTLYHWDFPQVLEDRYGGWRNKAEVVADFSNYANICFQSFGDRVKNWITINEPYVITIPGWFNGDCAPGRSSDRAFSKEGDSAIEPWIVGHNLMLAHAHASKLYSAQYKSAQRGTISITLNGDWAEPWDDQSPECIQATSRKMAASIGWFADVIFLGKESSLLREMLGDRLPTFTDEEWALLKDSSDFYGCNTYHTEYLDNLLAASVDDGVDVRSYFGWSLMDNWEWAEGYIPRFGVTWVDFNTGERVPKLSSAAVTTIAPYLIPLLGSWQCVWATPVHSSPSIGRRWPAPQPALSLSKYEQEIFDVTMQIQDWSWENSTGWIQSNDDNGHDSTRFTAWYIPGLLFRNQEDDLIKAIWAIKNILSMQFLSASDNGTAWYGDYKEGSDLPDPNNVTYTPMIYGSYDPNWSYFIGIQFVQIVAEFEHLLPADLVTEMVQSTYYAARALMARVGYDGDNLVTAYSNPAYARAIIVSWVGDRLGDQNLTLAGEQYGQDLYDLFTADGHNTLGEYMATTYYGEDVMDLCMWIRLAPASSSLPKWGKYILEELWEDIGDHYNYGLKNLVGPYDRVYHRNMLVDDAVISLWFCVSPVAPIGMDTTVYDIRQAASFALLGQTLRDTLNSTTIAKLTEYIGTEDRVFSKGIRVSLDNDTTRVNTMWMSENVMAGGQQVSRCSHAVEDAISDRNVFQLAEVVSRGNQFTPMIAHWKSGETTMKSRPFVSFFQLVATSMTLNATVTSGHVSITYPNSTAPGTDMFKYYIGDIPAPYYAAGQVMNGFANLPCLNVTISSEGLNGTVILSQYGDDSIQGNLFYTVTYYVNVTYTGIPSMDFDLAYTC
ncbi:hypothetical protein P7C73_g972, partial [Tremellales sp. Uapishka_1]